MYVHTSTTCTELLETVCIFELTITTICIVPTVVLVDLGKVNIVQFKFFFHFVFFFDETYVHYNSNVPSSMVHYIHTCSNMLYMMCTRTY